MTASKSGMSEGQYIGVCLSLLHRLQWRIEGCESLVDSDLEVSEEDSDDFRPRDIVALWSLTEAGDRCNCLPLDLNGVSDVSLEEVPAIEAEQAILSGGLSKVESKSELERELN